jgi:hypothetical protein
LIIDTRNKDLTIRVNKLAHHGDQVSHWFVNGTTKDTRVKISSLKKNARISIPTFFFFFTFTRFFF